MDQRSEKQSSRLKIRRKRSRFPLAGCWPADRLDTGLTRYRKCIECQASLWRLEHTARKQYDVSLTRGESVLSWVGFVGFLIGFCATPPRPFLHSEEKETRPRFHDFSQLECKKEEKISTEDTIRNE